MTSPSQLHHDLAYGLRSVPHGGDFGPRPSSATRTAAGKPVPETGVDVVALVLVGQMSA
jgi:hypothetical protein